MTTTITGQDIIAQLRAKLQAVRDDLNAEMSAAMDESLQAGKEAADLKIEAAVTPTGLKRAASRAGGQAGRVDTGFFEDEFTHESRQVDPNHMQGRLGWISSSAQAKLYVGLQEEGFDHKSGVKVEGVHALVDAHQIAGDQFEARVRKYVEQEFPK